MVASVGLLLSESALRLLAPPAGGVLTTEIEPLSKDPTLLQGNKKEPAGRLVSGILKKHPSGSGSSQFQEGCPLGFSSIEMT